MEADWSVEIGSDLPEIVVPWEGFVDLRQRPSLVSSIAETATNSALAEALGVLNATSSPVFTSKCDLWPLIADEIDPFEFEASAEEAQRGLACYIDIVAHSAALCASFGAHERWVRIATAQLRETAFSQARTDLVVRSSKINTHEGFGITLYVSTCAATAAWAESIFPAALQAATAITINAAVLAGE
jgi:hypothetical protein